jgi:hypothetical protein
MIDCFCFKELDIFACWVENEQIHKMPHSNKYCAENKEEWHNVSDYIGLSDQVKLFEKYDF